MNPVSAYQANQKRDHNQQVMQHLALVKRIAYHLLHRLPDQVQLDDLVQAGIIGLLEAAKNFDASHGASFETYAGIRIRGAMLDEVRRNDWAPRSVHRKLREVSEAIRQIEHRTGRDARDTEVASALGIELDEYHRIVHDASRTRVFSLDELQAADRIDDKMDDSQRAPDISNELTRQRFKEALAATITELPERERLVVALYYDEELNLREIGDVLEVSESRVCQIHGQAVARIRGRMREWLNETD
jgi:RNA polymerase sigma factor for flagellar operon FliA